MLGRLLVISIKHWIYNEILGTFIIGHTGSKYGSTNGNKTVSPDISQQTSPTNIQHKNNG